MVDFQTIRQLKAYARQDGAFLGAYWIVSFLLTLYFPDLAFGSVMILCTPLFAGWLLRRFRDEALDGRISFRRGLAYSAYTFFNGSFLFAFGLFIYLFMFDKGQFFATLFQGIKDGAAIYQAMGSNPKEVYDAIDTISHLSALQISFIFMMYYLMICAPLAVVIALLCRRKDAKHPHNNKTEIK
ncbi:DUF4199 domain-containing protein [Prevotella sp. A2931]|uniref:DUF4199 domain-containing protein n=1 Tax=Prevotella illustrans TaxID=2800387 RepID=A0ABS3M5Q9_9BACT|nr:MULTISPECIES: DUF4199 domain-containing protein [Prevotella]MBO1363514.1 DUF4199 domain-containing protein [Prevotella illustrans]PTL25984.1 DUF4199 domain-containing protein [Prevotella sp. oral taxon 820]